MSKAAYVRSEAARNTTFDHHCHWTGCTKSVPPAMWGCKQHWFKLPARLRARVWRTYRPGQEVTKTPSREYLAVTHEVQEWIAASVDTRPKDEDPAQTGASLASGAVGEAETPNLKTPGTPNP